MTTVINNPGNGSGESSGVGMVIGILLVIALVVLFFIYGLPALRNSQAPADNGSIDVNVDLPSGGGDNSSGGGSGEGSTAQ